MSEETYIDRIKASSSLAGLFEPDMKGENIAEGIDSRIKLASPLLESALRAAREGTEDKACGCCSDALALLEAYKVVVELTLDTAQREALNRRKGKAA